MTEPDAHRTVSDATAALTEAGLDFILMVLSDGEGAVLGNVHPVEAVKMLEGALKATRERIAAGFDVETMQ